MSCPSCSSKHIAEESEEELRHGLTQLQAAEYVYEARLFPDLEYIFKHALTHDVAYQSLLQERRKALQARVVEAIERLYRDDRAGRDERRGWLDARGRPLPAPAVQRSVPAGHSRDQKAAATAAPRITA